MSAAIAIVCGSTTNLAVRARIAVAPIVPIGSTRNEMSQITLVEWIDKGYCSRYTVTTTPLGRTSHIVTIDRAAFGRHELFDLADYEVEAHNDTHVWLKDKV